MKKYNDFLNENKYDYLYDLNIKAKVFEKPEDEAPIYLVPIENEKFYIQKLSTNSGPKWFEVEKHKNYWQMVKKGVYDIEEIGYTKQEAIEQLIKKYIKNKI